MAAYFNLINNEISKNLLVNKFNMILDNQGRAMLNDQKNPFAKWTTDLSPVHKNIFACLFSVHNTISYHLMNKYV